jgi:hypothetical protein
MAKRDIFRVEGEKVTGVNFEHVTSMAVEGNKITLSFYTNAIAVEFETSDAAKNAFEQLLKVWAGDVEIKQPEVAEVK